MLKSRARLILAGLLLHAALPLGCREQATPPQVGANAPPGQRDTLSRGAAGVASQPAAKPVGGRGASKAVALPRASLEPPPVAVRTHAAASGWPELEAPPGLRDFCTERVHTLDSDACFALPEARSQVLLIYLHGIVPPTRDSVQKTNFQRVVANASERANVVALLPRGKQGFAPAAYPGWWGWPTSKAAFVQQGHEFIEKVRGKQRKLEALLEATFERTYLAGSSSGAYFVAAVALHGAMPEVDGFGIVSGGSGYATATFETLSKQPVYIGFGKHDSVAGGARALAQRFERAGWPVQMAAHDVGHGAQEIYLDEAFAFWQRR